MATIKKMINSIKYHIVSLILFILLKIPASYSQDASKTNLKFDHIVLFVNNDALKDSLDKFFTPAEKLTTEHRSQGTIGYYYLFYNTFIELLFLADSTKALQNTDYFGSDYVSRWARDEGNCPIGFGMLMSPWDTSLVNTDFHKYQSNDSPDDEYYLMSNYNNDLSQPLIYVSMPHRAYKSLKSLEEIDQRPEEIRNDLEKYLTHSSRVKNLSQITYSFSNENRNRRNTKILKANSKIKIERADSTYLTLVFDNRRKNRKEFKLNEQTKLIINY